MNKRLWVQFMCGAELLYLRFLSLSSCSHNLKGSSRRCNRTDFSYKRCYAVGACGEVCTELAKNTCHLTMPNSHLFSKGHRIKFQITMSLS